MTIAIWLAARIHCTLRGHDMTQHGRLEQCGRCGRTWWNEVDW